MSTFVSNLKRYPKWKWHVVYILSVFAVSSFLFIYYRDFNDMFFQGAASVYFIYTTFFIDLVKLGAETKKRQLMTAFLGGAFVWMFIESSCKLFAKWAVWRFF